MTRVSSIKLNPAHIITIEYADAHLSAKLSKMVSAFCAQQSPYMEEAGVY